MHHKKIHFDKINQLDGERRAWIENNDQIRKKWMENKHDENRAWTTQKLQENQDWILKMEKEKMQSIADVKTEILDLLNYNTNKAIKEIGQHSINSKRQK